MVDVIEVFNARLHPGRLNQLAEALADRHGKLTGAGSDAHTLGEIAGAYAEVPWHENDAPSLLAALTEARVRGRTAPWVVHLASTWAKVRRATLGEPGRLTVVARSSLLSPGGGLSTLGECGRRLEDSAEWKEKA